MSEDSIASDSITCRTEANAPLLPPRKRLLAGFKQNGWPSTSSSSRAAVGHELPRSKGTLAHASAAKAHDLDQNSGDAADGDQLQGRGSLQSPNGAAESLDSQSKDQRKLKRQKVPSPSTTRKSSKKNKKSSSPEEDEDLRDGAVNETKLSVAFKIFSEVEDHTVGLVEGAVPYEEKEERVTSANGEESANHAITSKLGSNAVNVHKEKEEVTRDKAFKQNRNLARKSKMDSKQVEKADDIKTRRKMPYRQIQNKNTEGEGRKFEMHQEKVARPLADEELARQLHRAMNSSPRIARHLSPKEERHLLASNQKRF